MGRFTPWTPLMLAPIFTTAAGLVILLVPETARPKIVQAKHFSHARNTEEVESFSPGAAARTLGHQDADAAEHDDYDVWQQIQSKGWLRTTKSHFSAQFAEARGVLHDLNQPSVILLFVVFAVTAPLGKGFGQTFVQYVSKRYHKTIEDVGYLFALRGGLTLLIMGFLLPLLSHLLTFSSSPTSSTGRLPRRSFIKITPFRRDLLLAQGSALFSLLGFFGLSTPSYPVLVGSLAVESLGSGLLPLCRSMVTNFAGPDGGASHTTSLFSLVSMVETLGGLPAGLILAWLFSAGMRLGGGWWYGLPFLYLAACAATGFVVLLFVRPPPPPPPSPRFDEDGVEEEGDEEEGVANGQRRTGGTNEMGRPCPDDHDEMAVPASQPQPLSSSWSSSATLPLLVSASSSLVPPTTTLPVRQG